MDQYLTIILQFVEASARAYVVVWIQSVAPSLFTFEAGRKNCWKERWCSWTGMKTSVCNPWCWSWYARFHPRWVSCVAVTLLLYKRIDEQWGWERRGASVVWFNAMCGDLRTPHKRKLHKTFELVVWQAGGMGAQAIWTLPAALKGISRLNWMRSNLWCQIKFT